MKVFAGRTLAGQHQDRILKQSIQLTWYVIERKTLGISYKNVLKFF